MFTYRDGKKFCQIHPGTELQPGSTRLKRAIRLVLKCPDCDTLLSYLKTAKSPSERYLK